MQFEFEDSEVAALQLQGAAWQLRLSAARVFEGATRAGKGTGEGGWAALELSGVLPAGQAAVDAPACMGRLQAGCVRLNGQRLASLPVPWRSEAPLLLELEFAHGAVLQLHSQGLTLERVPGRCAVDAFQC